MDVTSIEPGALWQQDIKQAIEEASVFVVCWCCESRRSKYVAREVAMALKDPNKRLVPVLLCSLPLPATLASWNWIDIRRKMSHECNRRVHRSVAIQMDKTVLLSQDALGWAIRALYKFGDRKITLLASGLLILELIATVCRVIAPWICIILMIATIAAYFGVMLYIGKLKVEASRAYMLNASRGADIARQYFEQWAEIDHSLDFLR
jgi:hypothetical protein